MEGVPVMFRRRESEGEKSKTSSGMERSLRRAEQYYIRIILGGIFGLIVFVACCWGGYQAYAGGRSIISCGKRTCSSMRRISSGPASPLRRPFIGDRIAPKPVAFLEILQNGKSSRQALDWRRRVVDLQPDSLPDLVALAETALRFSQPKLAASTLARVPDARRNDSAYQSAAAHVALTLNHPEEALAHLKKAAELAPNDLRQQLELAEFEIRSKDESLRIEGRALANSLKALPDSQFAALGLLLDDALQTQDVSKAAGLAKELVGLEKAPFESQLRGLSALRACNDPDFVALLGRMQAEAARIYR